MNTIVILDDSTEDSALLTAALEDQTAPAIHTATTVEEAVQRMEKVLQDDESKVVCVCDYYLRCQQAEAAVGMIRANFAPERVAIIISSSLVPPAARQRLEPQVQAVWDKPVDLEGYDHLAKRILEMSGQFGTPKTPLG